MATDAEIARKLQLEEFQQGDTSDPDARLAWQLQQSEVSDVEDLVTEDISPDADEIGYDQASAVSRNLPEMMNLQDDERIALQLDEQLKLTQEQEDAVLAQQLFEEEEHSHSRATRPPTLPRREPRQRNRLRQQMLHYPTSGPGSRAVLQTQFDTLESSPDPDEPFHFHGHHHHHHLPRFGGHPLRQSMFGMMMRHNLFPTNMRPPEDVDLNDYEALWELAERIGNVKDSGVSQDVIDGLPSHAFKKDTHGAMSQKTDHECRICLSTFSEGENVKTLPCLHIYHQSCIDNWLQRKGDCPICRESVKEDS